MSMKILPSAERVRELLHYDPNTGVFTRLVSRRGINAKVGDVAGSVNAKGYLRITIDGSDYAGHRIAWLHVHGHAPAGEIDHINGQKDDNRIDNLRVVGRSGNMQNQRRARAINPSGFLGVHFHAGAKKWRAQIGVDGALHRLGLFATAEEAHEAYLRAKSSLHPFSTLPLM